jgi:hypothetical protein
MKEMVYKYDENLISQKREVLAVGTYCDYIYIVMSHSLYPAAYIDLPLRVGYKYLVSDIDTIAALDRVVDVHGGWNYACDYLDTGEKGLCYGFYVGWLYNTDDDFIAGEIFSNHKDGKKWTTAELIEEAKAVIKKLMAQEE